MPIIESLTQKVILEILKKSSDKTWKAAKRNDKVLKILEAVGLKPGKPDPNFESVYAYTLLEYGLEKPEPILEFFQHKDIRGAFSKSFQENKADILYMEAEGFVGWNKIGDDLREINCDPRLEFARFTLVFNEMVDRTRTPAEVRLDHKIDHIDIGVQSIIEWLDDRDLQDIRAKNLEQIQGSMDEQLKSWFKTLGYGFGNHDIKTDEYCEWIIKIPARRGYDSILVRCFEKQTQSSDLESLRNAVAELETDEGWIVVPRRVSQSARDMAEKDGSLFCYTFDELLDENADFSRYFDWLEKDIKAHEIDDLYVPLACTRDEFDPNTKEKKGTERYDEKNGWIEGYIDRWLDDPCKEHISILGEFGTGKTWFAHHYAYRLMQDYLEAKGKGLKRPRLPLVIHLRDYAKALKSESLFSDFFFRKHEIPLPGYSSFEQLNRMGRLLLIFDGFDEMADKLDHQKMVNNFWELARVVVPGSKAILTCRTEHFPNAKEGRDLLNAELKASTANLTGNPPQFEVLELELFDEDQIRDALSKRTDQKTVDLIIGHPELLDLASRPVMLEFILEALPDIEAGHRIDLSRIYLYAIRAKLERDFKSERTFTSTADKLFFMCELSLEMLANEEMSLNYRLFPDRLKNLFGEVVSEEKDLDHWHYDMMGNTLLIRNDDGDYTPAHRSLLEFFVAYKATAELGMLPSDFVALAQNLPNEDVKLTPEDYTWRSYFRREKDENGEVRLIPPLRRFSPHDQDGMLASLGRFGDNVLRFVHEITNVDEVRTRLHEFLGSVLNEFKDGTRDPEKQQDIISFLLKFKALSQEWEGQADSGDSIRCFWEEFHQREISDAKGRATLVSMPLKRPGEDPIKVEMVQIPKGSFLMGDERDDPIHQVNITRPYLISRIPVTQELYQAIVSKDPSEFKGNKRPVEEVSWFDAVGFCNVLSEMMNIEAAYRINGEAVEWEQGASGFRLPTEAEWEYAARAGASSNFACGDLESKLEMMAWYVLNSDGKTHPVKQKIPNVWGIFDMHGNVWEWVWDWCERYAGGTVIGPVGPSRRGSLRVVRGGSWDDGAHGCRSAVRGGVSPGGRSSNLGFRLSRSVALGPLGKGTKAEGTKAEGRSM